MRQSSGAFGVSEILNFGASLVLASFELRFSLGLGLSAIAFPSAEASAQAEAEADHLTLVINPGRSLVIRI
jgi:hypothetical protein